jgi:hypothetical protein
MAPGPGELNWAKRQRRGKKTEDAGRERANFKYADDIDRGV